MFLHVFRIDLVIFLLCFAISIVVRGCIPSSFSVIHKHEILIFMLVGAYIVCTIVLRLLPVLSLTAF
jgi:hypothetical protein